MSDERVMVFIDGSNLYNSLRREFSRTDIDFGRFSSALAADRRLLRTYYYNAPVDQTREPQRAKDQQRFFQRLRRLDRYEVKLGRLVYDSVRGQPLYEKGVDILMATDMLTHAYRDNYDVRILVSGDTDFADAVQAVKDAGKQIEVVLFGKAWSPQRLRDVADIVTSADASFLARCWL